MKSDKTILLVEDEPDAVTLMQEAFRISEINNPIQTLNDGERAIAYLRGDAPYNDRITYPIPAVILLDLKLPRKSGLEVLEWIKTQPHLRSIFVVVLTSSNANKDILRAYEFGAKSYLVKPASFHVLVDLIKSFKNYWLQFNEAPEITVDQP